MTLALKETVIQGNEVIIQILETKIRTFSNFLKTTDLIGSMQFSQEFDFKHSLVKANILSENSLLLDSRN